MLTPLFSSKLMFRKLSIKPRLSSASAWKRGYRLETSLHLKSNKSILASISMQRPGARFSKAKETFRARRKAIAKSRTLRLQSSFIHVFLIWTEFPFVQEISGRRIYTSPFLDTDELKNDFNCPKSFRGFRETGPWPLTELGTVKLAITCNIFGLFQGYTFILVHIFTQVRDRFSISLNLSVGVKIVRHETKRFFGVDESCAPVITALLRVRLVWVIKK